MDRLSVIGLVLAVAALIGGSILKGSGVAALVSPAAFVIVLVGTVAAIFVQTPPATFRRAMRIVKWVIRPPVSDLEQLIAQILEWSQTARKEGLLGLEALVEQTEDSFTRKGLQMLVDGSEPDVIRNVLEVELSAKEHSDIDAAKVFEGMGIYAPTLGIIGAVLGLMAVMQNLADPSKLGAGIAAAFVATIYGIASANLFFLPMGNKLKSVIKRQVQSQEILIEGLVSIANGENPRNIESKLQGYLDS
ncbi:MAG: flagellar motor protein [Salinisphaeraceae bacterium]|nr:flagellar motor protein [Salinisphaeraceae bacterium]